MSTQTNAIVGVDSTLLLTDMDYSNFVNFPNDPMAFDIEPHSFPSNNPWDYRFLCKEISIESSNEFYDLKGIGSYNKGTRIKNIDAKISFSKLIPLTYSVNAPEANPRADNLTILALLLQRDTTVSINNVPNTAIVSKYKGRYAFTLIGGCRLAETSNRLLYSMIGVVESAALNYDESGVTISASFICNGHALLSNI